MAHGDRSVDVFVRKLRAKLQRQSPGWSYIHTHFGIGYRFEPEPEPAGDQGDAELPAPVAEEEPSEAGSPDSNRSVTPRA